MAQSAYCGVMGAGKTYEAVKSVLIPGLRDGRRVVTNISGLQPGRIADLLNVRSGGLFSRASSSGEFSSEDIEKRLTVVDYERPNQPGFWPAAADDVSSVVRPGDLVIMDEAWRYCRDGEKLSEELMTFVRMHRQWADPVTKTSSDIVWIIQDIGSLNRKIRNLNELIWVMKKHRKLGLSSRYVATLYDGKISKATLVKIKQYRYEKRYFDLYKSYAVEGANEEYSDKRLNLLKDPKIWGIVALIIAMIVGGMSGITYIRGKYIKPTPASSDLAVVDGQPVDPSHPVAPGAQKPADPTPGARVLGTVGDGEYSRFVVVESEGRIQLRPEGDFTFTAIGPVGSSKNGQISPWSAPIEFASKSNAPGRPAS